MTIRPPPATSISVADLAEAIGAAVPPGCDLELTGVGTIEDAGPTEVTFLANDRYIDRLRASRAGAALVAEAFEGTAPMPLLRTRNPRIAFARVMQLFHPPRPRPVGVHPTAIVPASCTLGEHVYVGPYAVLGENVRLGDRVVVHAHAVVYADAVIGTDSEIHSHACVREGVLLGARVVLQNGAVVGSDGFGFEPDDEGVLQKVPQVGTVHLGDDVEVQANACVDRAALGATTVGEGTKIDNLVQIGHGCRVGAHAVLCGQAGLAGSTEVGDHVMLGGQVGSSGHIRIGDRVQVAAQSGIITDLEAGGRYGGTPAMDFKQALRASLFLPQLPEFSRRIKRLERAVERDAGG